MSCPSWQWHRTGSSWSLVRTLPVAPLWCDQGFFLNSCGDKAAANLSPVPLQNVNSVVTAYKQMLIQEQMTFTGIISIPHPTQ